MLPVLLQIAMFVNYKTTNKCIKFMKTYKMTIISRFCKYPIIFIHNNH